MASRFENRTAIVTGGARDIGRAVALRLAREGARVVVNYNQSADAAASTVQAIEGAGGRAVAVQADVTQEADVERLVRETQQAFGDEVHVLVNNAGGLVGRKRLDEMDLAFWRAVMDVNLTSTFLVTRAVVPHMPDGGSIVNLGSLAGRSGGGAGASAYAASKGAIRTFSAGLAKELGPRIRVNCLSAGLIDTTFHDTFTDDATRARMVDAIAVDREGTVEDVAAAVAFLASPEAGFITGESLEINGGMYFI